MKFMRHSRSSAVLMGMVILLAGQTFSPAVQAQSLFDRVKGLFGSGKQESAMPAESLGAAEIAGGLRDALRIGADRVISALGRTDGFYKAPDVHIPLPRTLRSVQSGLSRIGASGLVDDLELRLNRAAESAVPKAKHLFVDAISTMTITDAREILTGPDDAATQYFRQKMSTPLAAEMKPIVAGELAHVGALQSYDRMMESYRSIPFVPDISADLTDYVVERAIDGVFLYLGREEAAIRNDPAKRTTALLKKVFGG